MHVVIGVCGFFFFHWQQSPVRTDQRRPHKLGNQLIQLRGTRNRFPAFGYSEDAKCECAAFHRRTGRIIKLLTVQEILDEEHVQKM